MSESSGTPVSSQSGTFFKRQSSTAVVGVNDKMSSLFGKFNQGRRASGSTLLREVFGDKAELFNIRDAEFQQAVTRQDLLVFETDIDEVNHNHLNKSDAKKQYALRFNRPFPRTADVIRVFCALFALCHSCFAISFWWHYPDFLASWKGFLLEVSVDVLFLVLTLARFRMSYCNMESGREYIQLTNVKAQLLADPSFYVHLVTCIPVVSLWLCLVRLNSQPDIDHFPDVGEIMLGTEQQPVHPG